MSEQDNATSDRPVDPSGDPSRQLLAAIDKLTRAVEDLPRQLRGTPATPRALPAAEPAANHYLVYVHGICRHDAGYSNPWWTR